MPISNPHGVPVSTYRLQLRKEFSFSDACRILSYLHDLGVDHCYLSPVLMSAPGSTHGYDVNDYHRIDAELGGRASFEDFSRSVRAQGMGVVLDIVPNHMGIGSTSNQWWQDVLECGPASPFADFFDIDWGDPDGAGRAQVLVPILDDQYGLVLEAGRFDLRFIPATGAFTVQYGDLNLPLHPGTWATMLSAAAHAASGTPVAQETLRALAKEAESLMRKTDGPIPLAPREDLRRRLAKAAREDAGVGQAISAQLELINGRPGDPRSFDRLDAVLNDQHYRLAHWKTGVHEVNYRRFFAIDSLIGLRMENARVFEETHRLVAALVRENLAQGLRIDHIDGLRNPLEYLERLQRLLSPPRDAPGAPFYTVVEKILAEGEELDAAWPTHGTTGYEFIRQLADVLVAPEAEPKFTRLYRDFTTESATFENVVYGTKRHVLEEMFANAVTHLGHELARLVATDRCWRDLTRHELGIALREIMAGLRVYRIYRRLHVGCRPEDEREVERAFAEAVRRNPNRDAQTLAFVRDVLVGRYPPASAALEQRVSFGRWVLTFQQYTGAIMAKAAEDTAFYVYNRFVALNEVGGDPGQFGGTVESFHAANARRREVAPHSLLATSTHDTKFGEDARARLYVLSEIPNEWADWVGGWRELNRRCKTEADGRSAPDDNEEYRFYQTLLACWPADATEPDDTLRSRLREHVRKAVNEAKVNTHWLHPNEAWLEAGDRFVDTVLSPESGRKFLADFVPKAERLAHLGLVNTLAQVVLKCTSPGVPDFYQGSEGWNLSLVDPDNRRLVAWRQQEAFARTLQARSWRDLLRDWKSGGIKWRLTRALLRFRREHAAVFQEGDYLPLETTGRFADRVIAFARRHETGSVVVVVPCRSASLGCPPLGLVWEDTTLLLPSGPGVPWRDVFSGKEVPEKSSVGVADLFNELPVSVLACEKLGTQTKNIRLSPETSPPGLRSESS